MVKILAKYLQRSSFLVSCRFTKIQTLRILTNDFETPYYSEHPPSSGFFLWSEFVTERCFSKGHPVPVAKEFDKYLQKNSIFKKVTDIQLEFHKN